MVRPRRVAVKESACRARVDIVKGTWCAKPRNGTRVRCDDVTCPPQTPVPDAACQLMIHICIRSPDVSAPYCCSVSWKTWLGFKGLAWVYAYPRVDKVRLSLRWQTAFQVCHTHVHLGLARLAGHQQNTYQVQMTAASRSHRTFHTTPGRCFSGFICHLSTPPPHLLAGLKEGRN